MVFSSIEFIFAFLTLCLVIYFISLRFSLKLANSVLLIFSLIFYIKGEKGLVLVMVLSSSIDYFLGKYIYESMKKDGDDKRSYQRSLLFASIALNLGILFYFKYYNFFVESIYETTLLLGIPISLKTLKISLPLGISFYTFQSMSYTIDVYRKNIERCYNFWSFLSYVTLFPQLVAGPIVRYRDVELALTNRLFLPKEFLEGVTRFSFGLAKKVFIANQMSIYADMYFDQPAMHIDTLGAWIGIVSYTLQIYFDFSGYSDMAIGLGHMFGFKFPENFNYPYQAKSIQDFWHRWHISLSTWFRDYLYIPLGGNRHGEARTIFNQYMVFFLCGLWHGASWNFIIWGLFHGTLLFIERVLRQKGLNPFKPIIGNIYTMLMAMVGWVYFRAQTLTEANTYLGKMFSFGINSHISLKIIYKKSFLIGLTLGLFLCTDVIMRKFKEVKTPRYALAFILLILTSLTLVKESFNPFIYFRF